MSKKTELITTKALVKSILEQVPETRNSDMCLYYEVCKTVNPGALDYDFGMAILNLDVLHLPPFETVRRTRQFIQRKFPDLSASSEVQVFRAENETVFEEFARGDF